MDAPKVPFANLRARLIREKSERAALRRIRCKNDGCSNPRQEGSSRCKACSEKHSEK